MTGRPSPRGTHLGDGAQLPLKYAGMLGRRDEGWRVRDGGAWQDGPGTIVEAQRQWVTCKETGSVYLGLLYTSLLQRPDHSTGTPQSWILYICTITSRPTAIPLSQDPNFHTLPRFYSPHRGQRDLSQSSVGHPSLCHLQESHLWHGCQWHVTGDPWAG